MNIQALEDLIRTNKLDIFCTNILNQLQLLNSSPETESLRDDVLILSSNLYNLQQRNKLNSIEIEAYQTERSKIISGLLTLFREYKNLLTDNQTKDKEASSGVALTFKNSSEPIALFYGLSGAYQGSGILITDTVRKITFGRGNDTANSVNDLFIKIEDHNLSRAHCSVRITPVENLEDKTRRTYEWIIQDLASSNGTFVNGKIVKAGSTGLQLTNRSIIHIGNTKIQLILF